MNNHAKNIKSGRYKYLNSDDGITLVEILVVLGIIALIAGFAAPRVFQYLGSSRTKAASIQLKNIQTALELYYVDVGEYPDSETGLAALVKKPDDLESWNGPYIKSLNGLDDPWGRRYNYELSIGGNVFELSSLGRDGKKDGEGEDKDIFD